VCRISAPLTNEAKRVEFGVDHFLDLLAVVLDLSVYVQMPANGNCTTSDAKLSGPSVAFAVNQISSFAVRKGVCHTPLQ
jgi:hypothetical protein